MREFPVRWRRGLLWLAPSAFLLVFFYFPLARILGVSFRSADLAEAWSKAAPLAARALGFTLWQAALSTLITLLVGLPLAWFFARYSFRGKRLLHALTAVPFMLPTVVVAAGFNALLGPRVVNLALMQALTWPLRRSLLWARSEPFCSRTSSTTRPSWCAW
jgi:thiamine transport system permease protein